MPIQRYETSPAALGNDWVYGTGADGDVTISGTVTLTSDKYYNNLTVPLGNVLLTNGYRVFVKNTASINGVVGIGTVTGNSNGVTNGTITSPGFYDWTPGKTLAGSQSTVIYRTGGLGGGSIPPPYATLLPEYLVKRIESFTGAFLHATYEDSGASNISGGAGGTVGSTGTPATSYTNANPAPSGFTNTWPNKSGAAGSAGSAGSWPPNAHSVGQPGGRGATGATGSAGSAPNPPIATNGGAGGEGGFGGGVVGIFARTINGSGTIMSLGQIGADGQPGPTSPAGPNGATGAAGAPAPGYTDHHHHSTVIHDPHTHGGHAHDSGSYHKHLYVPPSHHNHIHHYPQTIHAPCCTAGPHYPGGAGGAGGAGGTGSPAVTGGTGKRGGAGGGGTIIIITETTPSSLNYDVRAGTTADSDVYSATSGSTYIILNA